MNQRFNKTFVITKEYGNNGAIFSKSRAFKQPRKAAAFGTRFLASNPSGHKRHVEIYEVIHLYTKTVGRVSKHKASPVEKKV